MRAHVVELVRDERVAPPPVRIRTLLLLAALAVIGFKVYPRAQAAWQLHGLASALADYSLCMVGPTGPSLIRDNPGDFSRLVRRRLVSAASEEQPFAACAGLARELTGSEQVAAAHAVSAGRFREYEPGAAPTRDQPSLAELAVTSEPLAEMSRRAFPFVRGGYARLVKASLSAHEAVHPIAPAKPALGSGLPSWRAHYRAVHKTQAGFVMAQGQGANLALYETRDAGVSWRRVAPRHEASDFTERCPIDDDGRSFTFSLSDDGRSTIVNSLGPDGAPYATVLAPSDRALIGSACDADGLAVALTSAAGGSAGLWLCPFRRSCAPMRLPDAGGRALAISDVARIDGTTVIATLSGSIVRVASSRDAGRSWTPLSVAYDADEDPAGAMGLPPPGRLLALDDRLVLYGGAERSNQAYLLLLSDDSGASWRTP
jgi:hypothetical protein